MAARQILVSWIGHNDLLSAAATHGADVQHDVLKELKIERKVPLKVQTGPIRTLLDQEAFDEVHLLGDYSVKLRDLFGEWLGHSVKIHPVSLEDPSNFAQILEAVDLVMGEIGGRRDCQYSFLLTPGTPSMAATWILVGKARYDATFWQTYDGQASRSEVPFDVVAAFATELAYVPDENLQYLASASPAELEGFGKISGTSKELKMAAGRAARAAARDVPVLILGEPGTGKELFAEAIHDASRRAGKPFLRINCAAVPDHLLEAQLFGYVEGAFTNAKAGGQPGVFQQADGGTLFLDEVGECSPEMQAALLRVLQPPKGKGPCYREFSPVGDLSKTRHSDVRIVSATNRDLTAAVEAGKFREDLFYRLAVFKVKLPPLRSRKSDIPELTETLMNEINADFRKSEPEYQNRTVSEDAKRFLRQYSWPGNIRQLKNTLVEAAVMCIGTEIRAVDLKAAIADVPGKSSSPLDYELGSGFSLDSVVQDVQRHYVTRALEEADYSKRKAADLLGLASYQALDAKLKSLRMKIPKRG